MATDTASGCVNTLACLGWRAFMGWECAAQDAGGHSGRKPDLHGPNASSPKGPRAPTLNHKLGYAGSLVSESFGTESSLDDGTASVQLLTQPDHDGLTLCRGYAKVIPSSVPCADQLTTLLTGPAALLCILHFPHCYRGTQQLVCLPPLLAGWGPWCPLMGHDETCRNAQR